MKIQIAKHQYILYYTIYSILFIILVLGIFFPFYSSNKIMAWVKDAPSILYPAFCYLGDSLKEIFFNGSFDSYSLSLGLGNDIFSFLGTWYLEPLSFLAFFVPKRYYEEAYLFIIIFRFYLAGISFSIYSLYMKNRYWSTLLSSFVYIFSIYGLIFGVKWPVFLMPMVYLPLLFVGIEKIIKRKSMFLFVGITFISAWSSYFYLYINTIICVLYFLLRAFQTYGNIFKGGVSLKIFLNRSIVSILSYILGIGMSFIVLLPNIYVFFNSNRSSGAKQSIENMLYYGKGWIGGLLKYSIAPVKAWAYSPLPEFDLFIGVIPISFIAIIILFFNRRLKEHLQLKIFAFIMGLFLVIPFFAYILSGFNVITHRWAYILILFIAFLFAKFLPEYNKINKLTGVILFMYGMGYAFLVYREEKENIYVQVALSLLLISLIWVFFANFLKFSYGINMSGISLIVFGSLLIFSNYTYSEDKGNLLYEYVDCGELSTLANGTMSETMEKIESDDNSVYRIDEGRSKRESLSASVLNSYYGCSFYNNVMDKNVAQYMRANSNAGLRENILCLGFDSRTYLEEIAGVKYYIPSDEVTIPYGYTLNRKYSTENKKVYENKYALPIGFMYTDTISQKEYEELDILERQEVMLKALVLDGEQNMANDYVFQSSKLKTEVSDCNGLKYDDGKVLLNDNFYLDGGYIELEFDFPDNSEVYIGLEGIDINAAGFADWSFLIEDVECGRWKEKSILSDYNTYSPGINNYYINLGYEEKGGKHHIRLHIPTNACDFNIDNIIVYAQSFDNYEKDVEKLQENSLQNIEIDNNTVVGDIKTETSGWLYLAIPYSEGWTAYVDQKKVDVSRGNIMYMAIPLEKGTHDIRFEYEIPGLKAGGVISGISWLIFIFANLRRKYIG